MKLMGMDLVIPCYTTCSRRAAHLDIDLTRLKNPGKKHIVVDASGLKVFGEGEWKVRTHGKGKRRTWRKIHLSFDAKSHEVIACELTRSNTHESLLLDKMLPSKEETGYVYCDGAYDTKQCYRTIAARGGKARIIPRHGAALIPGTDWGAVERNTNVKNIWMWGRKNWKEMSGYHRRSLAETGIFRFKKTFGGSLTCRHLPSQRAEVRLKSAILNKMTQLGMPESYRIR